jgi:hypothetical protein
VQGSLVWFAHDEDHDPAVLAKGRGSKEYVVDPIEETAERREEEGLPEWNRGEYR